MRTPALVLLNEGDSEAGTRSRTLYCVHSVSGAARADYLELARQLDSSVRLYGIQAPLDRMLDLQFGSSIESLADCYIDAVVRSQPEGPLMIGGYSLGAVIALDMAKKLRAAGREVGPVIAIDGAPQNVPVLSSSDPRYWLEVASNVPHWFMHADLIKNPSARSLMWSLSRRAIAIGKGAIGLKRAETLGGGISINHVMDLSPYPPAQKLFINRLFSATFSYVPENYLGDVVVYEANTGPLFGLSQIGRIWKRIARRSEIVKIVGTHRGMMRGPYLVALADDIRCRVSEFFDACSK